MTCDSNLEPCLRSEAKASHVRILLPGVLSWDSPKFVAFNDKVSSVAVSFLPMTLSRSPACDT